MALRIRDNVGVEFGPSGEGEHKGGRGHFADEAPMLTEGMRSALARRRAVPSQRLLRDAPFLAPPLAARLVPNVVLGGKRSGSGRFCSFG
jgi:hypothetical protein